MRQFRCDAQDASFKARSPPAVAVLVVVQAGQRVAHIFEFSIETKLFYIRRKARNTNYFKIN